MNNQHGNPEIRRRVRGLTIVEVAAASAAIAVAASVAIPVFQRVGCNAMREQSAANLAALGAAHAVYANDFAGRQFTACPDELGVFGGSFLQYQNARGCIPNITLGTTSSGQTYNIGYGSGTCPGTADGGAWLLPVNWGVSGTLGSCALTNVRQFNSYVGGRFFDQRFYAPDDPTITRKVQRWINEGRDFEFEQAMGLKKTTYIYSPAAMYHPRVMGDGTNALSPLFLSPNSVPGGLGYRSPANSECQYPSLKTRMLESYVMENSPGMNPASGGGTTPYYWNQSYRSRANALFFDGSVRVFTTSEAMLAERRLRGPKLWVRTTPFGSSGFYGNFSNDFIVSTSVHFLTANGIRGRDTVAPD